MPKPRKFDDSVLTGLITDFFEANNGDPSALSYRALAAYAAERGINAGEHLFRKPGPAREYIDRLKNFDDAPEETPADVFADMDIEAILRKSSSVMDLKKRLAKFSDDWRRCYMEGLKAKREAAQMAVRQKEVSDRCSVLETEVLSLRTALEKAIKERDQVIRLFQDYVYPHAAARILSEKIPGLKIPSYCIPEGLNRLTKELRPKREDETEEPAKGDGLMEAAGNSPRSIIARIDQKTKENQYNSKENA